MIGLADIEAAAGRIAGKILRTPALPSHSISRATGARVTLKLENLQARPSAPSRSVAPQTAWRC